MFTEAKWTNGKRIITGRYRYNWAGDNFVIWLDSKDRITGQDRKFTVYNDLPEWGKWRKVNE